MLHRSKLDEAVPPPRFLHSNFSTKQRASGPVCQALQGTHFHSLLRQHTGSVCVHNTKAHSNTSSNSSQTTTLPLTGPVGTQRSYAALHLRGNGQASTLKDCVRWRRQARAQTSSTRGTHRAGTVLWLVLPLVPRLYLYKAANAPYRRTWHRLYPGTRKSGQERTSWPWLYRRTGGQGKGEQGAAAMKQNAAVAESSQHCSVNESQASTCQAVHTQGTRLPEPLLSMRPRQMRT